MYIADFIPDKDDLLTRALASPKLKKGCDVATVVRAVHEAIEAIAKDKLRDEIMVDLSDAAAGYEVINGLYEDAKSEREQSEYESGIDDVIEKALEPYEAHLSADWLGRNTIGTLAWKPDELRSLAVSAGKEVWKQLTYEKTPAQILANAGIVHADIEARLSQPPQPHTETKGNMTVSEQLGMALQTVKAHIGKDFDALAVYEDIDMIVTEDDDILVNGAAARLGMSQNEIDIMQIAAMSMDDPSTEIFDLLKATNAPGTKPTKRAAAAKPEKGADNGLATAIMSTLKSCGVQDTAMAEALGVSRSTYVKYCDGKSVLVPTNDQHDLIRTELVTRANLLLAALASLDGTEATEVA